MADGLQTVPYLLPSQTFAAGGTTVQTLQVLPKQYLNNRLAHLSALVISGTVTPTYTTAPTVVGTNNLATKFDFYDGSIYRFQGSLTYLRQMERLYNGGSRLPDPDTDTASASARYVNRTLHMGPPQMNGSPSDFLLPTGLLQNGTLTIGWGNLTDISADTTAATGSLRLVAKLAMLDELRIPPAYQALNVPLSGTDNNIAARALYLGVGLIKSSGPTNLGTIAAGDLGNVTLDFGFGQLVPGINVKDLTNAFLDDFPRGDLVGVMGEPAGATDDNGKGVNHGTPTALLATPADLQPIVWTPDKGRLSKAFVAETVARLRYDGSGTGYVALIARILAQESQTIGAVAAKALAGTGLGMKSMSIRTLSKKTYNGPLGPYFPWKVKVGPA